MALNRPGLGEATVYLVRHGQSSWNVDGRIQGQAVGIELTDRGRTQAAAAARALRDSGATRVLSSDLIRAVQTATPIAAALGVPVELEPGLRERGMGIVEGHLTDDVLAAHPDVNWRDPDLRFAGGESKRDVYDRLAATLGKLVGAEPIVVVSHGDAIRLAVDWLCGHPVEDARWYDVGNGSITEVRVRPGTATTVNPFLPAP
jgi:probable phosphoglycerate mutase